MTPTLDFQMNPEKVNMTATGVDSAQSDIPLSFKLSQWSRVWKEQRALGALVDAELEFGSLLDLLPGPANHKLAIASTDPGRQSLRFSRLHEFLKEGFPFHELHLGPNDRCVIALPEGPELAVCLLGTSMRCVAAPMNPWSPEGEIEADLAEIGAKAVVVQVGEDFDPIRRAARERGVSIIDLAPRPREIGLFDLGSETGGIRGSVAPFNTPDNVALTLFTSGTSGRKKLVQIRLRDLCVGASCLAAALELGPEDRGYNMMPLFHVGGIVRNLFAPFLAGSGMIYSSGFDAVMFWDELDRGADFNWYYASPTMHESILQEGATRPHSRHTLRFICNAAGELLPSTAVKLRVRFGDATVLPGYGMTECMPIACPPLDYRLEPRGTSGRILGPEVSIRDEAGEPLPVGRSGRILIRGAPVAQFAAEDAASTDPLGPSWFDTGDLGYFDEDGFLYIVGRGKDIIKRGGETIAPAEIEEILIGHPDVRAALVFAVPHSALGETVGAVIVPRSGRRVDLDGLSAQLSKNLIPAKWPVILVYMEDLPTSSTGKLLRIGLAGRLGIDGVDEKSPMLSRLFEADCPARGVALSTPIGARPVEVTAATIEAAIRASCPEVSDVYVQYDELSGTIRAAVEASNLDDQNLRAHFRGLLHDYLVPRSLVVLEIFPRDAESGAADLHQLSALLDGPRKGRNEPSDEIESVILHEWRACLGQDRDVFLDSDFFDELGGDSLTAVRIIANVRKRFAIALPPTSIFRNRTISSLAAAVRIAIAARASGEADEPGGDERSDRQESPPAKAQNAFTTLIAQLLPVALLPPVLRLAQFVGWMFTLWYMRFELRLSGAWVVFASMAIASAARHTLAPLAAIAAKWLIIGRYRPGIAPLWGHTYLRWWLVRQIQTAAGPGIFSGSYTLTAIYYRLLGARIGRGTRIASNADLGEFDLLTIGDNVCIEESAIVRPFALEGGGMALRPIAIGANASIGIRATVVPGTMLPAHTDIAPMASSNEAKGRNLGTRALCRQLVFSPPMALKSLGLLIKGALALFSWAPVFLLTHHVLSGLVPTSGVMISPHDLLLRLMRPERLAIYSSLLVMSTLVSPFLYLAGVILVKWTVIGRFRAGTDTTRPWPMFERWLMWQLLPNGHFGEVSRLIGANFGGVSVIYRLLGSKVGKRVYWPGSGNVLVEYDLFSCGDDVTFGSRSTFLMTSLHGSKPIHIEAGANVSDRCVLAPGVRIERNAVLGSGTFAPENFVAPAGSTWIGHGGPTGPIELEEASPRKAEEPTIRPYGLAMYEGKASYPVWPLSAHITFNLAWATLAAIFRAAPMIGALALTRATIVAAGPDRYDVLGALLVLCGFYLPLYLASVVGALWIRISTKWLVVGHRVAGEHFWHQSSYCQRWKIHCVISAITSHWSGSRDLLTFFEGSAFLVWFFRAQGAQIGHNVCLYPNGADPMMEEPDFLKIGDGALIDQAILIAHLNTRGEWTMGPIEIAARSCLRSMSRVMMLSAVGERSILLERTLVLAGDSSLPGATWHGWPGEQITAKAMAKLRALAVIQRIQPSPPRGAVIFAEGES
jgi:acyl-CoA synthetase (AMP-forming)/AMP-acid ligase II/acetyltransferase-like isoleucine patch superfamily enzyme/acyl carrier protein